MTRFLTVAAVLAIGGCGAPSDRLTDEQAAAEQEATIEAPIEIEVPPPERGGAPPPQPVVASYSAIGTEPGWSLRITPKTMKYEGDYGSTTIVESTPASFRPVPGRYTGLRLLVTISAGPCNDGMSDRTYRDTITVVADGETFLGCGGGALPTADAEIEEPATAG